MSALGRLAYRLWFRPTAKLRLLATREGLRDATVARWAAKQMAQAAMGLPPLPTSAAGFPVHFLSGRGFWHLTTFAAHSLLLVSSQPLQLVFEDDGSLDEATAARFRRMFPGCRIHSAEEQDAQLEEHLPADRFPTLRRDLGAFLLLRKLTAPHLGAQGRRALLDSDVLFFRQPHAFDNWIRGSGSSLLYMTDVNDQYGAERSVLDTIAGRPVPARVNTGLVGAASETLDWTRLEFLARRYLDRIGPSHFIEQSLTAMAAAELPAQGLPATDYIVAPPTAEARLPRAVAHHYAGPSRHLLYRYGWRRLSLAQTASTS